MAKVVVDVSMSLDGFIAGPDDDRAQPLGVILTHKPPPTFPKGKSEIVFVTDGIESAVSKAKALAKNKHVGIGGASVAQQALKAGLVDELLLHIAPILLGEGVRLFEHLGDEAIRLRKISSLDVEDTSHLRYEVLGH